MPPPRAEVLRLTRDGFERLSPEAAIARVTHDAARWWQRLRQRSEQRAVERRAIPDDAVAADAGALSLPGAARRRPTWPNCAA